MNSNKENIDEDITNDNMIPNNINNFSLSLKKDGLLIVSGFNSEKKPQIIDISMKNNLKFVKSFENQPWISIIFQKS